MMRLITFAVAFSLFTMGSAFTGLPYFRAVSFFFLGAKSILCQEFARTHWPLSLLTNPILFSSSCSLLIPSTGSLNH
jgi:hypothetical protein